MTSHPTDISADPLLVPSDYHIYYDSPCRDAGCDSAGLGVLDIDCLPRIVGPHIDIGAHETNTDFLYYFTSLTGPPTSTGDCIPYTQSATVIANVFDAIAFPSIEVNISVNAGIIVSVNGVSVNATSATGATDSNGNVTIVVSDSSGGSVTVTATTVCACPMTRTFPLCFTNPPQPVPVEIFFCIDSTYSMSTHRAEDGVTGLINYLTSQGVTLRLGGLKFNDPEVSGPDTLNANEFRSLSAFSSVSNFESAWLNDGYQPNGGDSPELQLDALDSAAQDMTTYSTPGYVNRYIVLITDNVFHYLYDPYGDSNPCYSNLIPSTVIADLQNSGCKVYISLYDDGDADLLNLIYLYNSDYTTLRQVYTGLDVNGDFDTVNLSSPIYTFDKLEPQIMAHWPAY